MTEPTTDDIQAQLRARGICVIIPTYNNGLTIGRVVQSVCRYCRDVIVVDDGSTDDTPRILAAAETVTTVRHARNRGKGHALRSGMRRALGMGFAYAITLDADGQHFAHDIPAFLEANRRHPGCIIIGSRTVRREERSAGSNFANSFSNFWFTIQTGRRLPDTQSGYRLYPLRRLRGLALLTARYEAELELLVFPVWRGVDVHTVPISVYYPPREERVSHFRPVPDFSRISVLNTVLTLLCVVYGWPRTLLRLAWRYAVTLYALLFFLFFSVAVFMLPTWLYVSTGRMTERKRLGLHRIIRWFARLVMIRHGIPRTRFVQRVSPRADFDTPHIVISNHQSQLDLMCLLVFSEKIVFLTKEWVWRNPFYGYIIRHAEYLPVTDGLEPLLPQLRSLVARGYSIAVFPEGTRSADCRMGRFHKGAFYLARELGLDIQPVCLYGPGKVLPKHGHTLRPGIICVEAGDPVSRERLSSLGTLQQQASALRRHLQGRYEALCNELEQNA